MSNHSFIPSTCNAPQKNHRGHNTGDSVMYWRTFEGIKMKIQTIKALQVYFNFLFKAQTLRMAVVFFCLMSSKGLCFQAASS